jgi:hypothetical protein
MAEPAYAIVDILCDPAQLKTIEAIPHLRIEVRPEYTSDPGVILVHAFADAAAQAAVAALGCRITVIKSAEAYQKQIESAYGGLGQDGGGTDPVG